MKTGNAGMRRWRRAATATLTRMVDARIGPRQSESEQARLSTHDVALFSAFITAVYLVFYLANDRDWFGLLVPVAVVCVVAHVVAVVLARKGYQLGAAMVSIAAAIVAIISSVAVLGWQSGFHLYLISSGVLVFVVFTAKQAVFRGIFIGAATVAFIACQTVIGQHADGPLSSNTAEMLFSVNAVLTALFVSTLSGLSYSRINQARAELASHAMRADYLANTDALTGLSNRRPVMEWLDAESARGRGGYSVAIADLDHFKTVNDTYGHECGDVVLAHISAAVKDCLRPTEAVGRWGGEEFIVVLPDTTVELAATLMERVRVAIEELLIPCDGHTHAVTISIGVADGADDALWHRVVKRADDALYDAKMEGRNLVRSRPLVSAAAEAPAEEFSLDTHREQP